MPHLGHMHRDFLFGNHACWFLCLHEKMGRNLPLTGPVRELCLSLTTDKGSVYGGNTSEGLNFLSHILFAYREAWLGCGHLLPFLPTTGKGIIPPLKPRTVQTAEEWDCSVLMETAWVTPDTSHRVRRGHLLSWLLTAPAVSSVHLQGRASKSPETLEPRNLLKHQYFSVFSRPCTH